MIEIPSLLAKCHHPGDEWRGRISLYDGHGSTRALVNGASIVERYAYDAYGLVYRSFCK